MDPEQISKILNSFEIYLKSNRVTQTTINTYKPVAKRFLDSISDNTLDETAFRTYQANNYMTNNNTARKVYYALLALYKSQKIAISVQVPPMEDHPKRPTINPNDMERLIIAIRAGGDSTERGLLALSSIYGLRRTELRHIGKLDLNYDNKTITVRAAKHGRERAHLIPDCVWGYISNYDFKLLSDTEYSNIFWGMIKKANLMLAPKHGWHSIRRALYTGFITNGFDYFLRHEFMRWKIRGLDLDSVYSQNTPDVIDNKAFEKHPFLRWWG